MHDEDFSPKSNIATTPLWDCRIGNLEFSFPMQVFEGVEFIWHDVQSCCVELSIRNQIWPPENVVICFHLRVKLVFFLCTLIFAQWTLFTDLT